MTKFITDLPKEEKYEVYLGIKSEIEISDDANAADFIDACVKIMMLHGFANQTILASLKSYSNNMERMNSIELFDETDYFDDGDDDEVFDDEEEYFLEELTLSNDEEDLSNKPQRNDYVVLAY